ncbi:MAG: hypothetical protein AAB669_00685 [Patescibacteria group bacterium]
MKSGIRSMRATSSGLSSSSAIGNVVARSRKDFGIEYATKRCGDANWEATLTSGSEPHSYGGLSENDAIGNVVERYGKFHGIEVVINDRRQQLPGAMFGYHDPETGKETELTQEQISNLDRPVPTPRAQSQQ